MRESLTRILSKQTDFCLLPDIGNADSRNGRNSVVLVLDSAKPILSGFDGVPAAKGEEYKVILVGMNEDEAILLEVIRRGVMGYLLKDASSIEVVSAVRTVARGEAVCPQKLCRFLFEYVAAGPIEVRDGYKLPGNACRLTRREDRLIPLIRKGLTNKQMAAVLGVSEQTVKNHVHRILRKTGAEDRASIPGVYSGREHASIQKAEVLGDPENAICQREMATSSGAVV